MELMESQYDLQYIPSRRVANIFATKSELFLVFGHSARLLTNRAAEGKN